MCFIHLKNLVTHLQSDPYTRAGVPKGSVGRLVWSTVGHRSKKKDSGEARAAPLKVKN